MDEDNKCIDCGEPDADLCSCNNCGDCGEILGDCSCWEDDEDEDEEV